MDRWQSASVPGQRKAEAPNSQPHFPRAGLTSWVAAPEHGRTAVFSVSRVPSVKLSIPLRLSAFLCGLGVELKVFFGWNQL